MSTCYADDSPGEPEPYAQADGVLPKAKAESLFGPNYAKLREVKKKYDANVVFNKWFAIAPAAA